MNRFKFMFKFFILVLFFILFISCGNAEKIDEVTKKPIKYTSLTVKNYDKVIKKNNGIFVVGFFSRNDKLNNDQIASLNSLAITLEDSIGFGVVNIERELKLSKDQDIKCVPTYKIFNKSKLVRTLNGSLDSLHLDNLITMTLDAVIEDTTTK